MAEILRLTPGGPNVLVFLTLGLPSDGQLTIAVGGSANGLLLSMLYRTFFFYVLRHESGSTCECDAMEIWWGSTLRDQLRQKISQSPGACCVLTVKRSIRADLGVTTLLRSIRYSLVG